MVVKNNFLENIQRCLACLFPTNISQERSESSKEYTPIPAHSNKVRRHTSGGDCFTSFERRQVITDTDTITSNDDDVRDDRDDHNEHRCCTRHKEDVTTTSSSSSDEKKSYSSSTIPIPCPRTPRRSTHHYDDDDECYKIESQYYYDQATWSMYNRIMSYRIKLAEQPREQHVKQKRDIGGRGRKNPLKMKKKKSKVHPNSMSISIPSSSHYSSTSSHSASSTTTSSPSQDVEEFFHLDL